MRLIVPWLAALLFASAAAAQGDRLTAEKEADIRQLIGATGGTRLATQLADATTRPFYALLRQSRPDLNERALPVINRELLAFFKERLDAPGELNERILVLYHHRFTHAEIKELLAFYKTALGRKSLTITQLVSNESFDWSRKHAPEMRRILEAALVKEGLTAPAKR
ncbi:MAG TPA: DUF2059 domain-containing protein [Burkholderiales bacterium]|nr:DUF2059 domain-containing protein [Burkholderiales bacterium]